jgi:hypothetical protein
VINSLKFIGITPSIKNASAVKYKGARRSCNDVFLKSRSENYPYNIISRKNSLGIIKLINETLKKLSNLQLTQFLVKNMNPKSHFFPEKLCVCSDYLEKKNKLAEAMNLNEEASSAIINRMNKDGKYSKLGKKTVDNLECFNDIEEQRGKLMQKLVGDGFDY